MPSGGAREGAGRKTKAEELGLSLLIDEVIGEAGKKKVIKQLYKKAQTGSYPHTQLLLAYIYGKPAEKVDVGGGLELFLTRRVVK